MTKEQKEKALAFLKDMQECTYDGLEEIRTAIEALEQQPSDDCVSRQAVLNTLFYKSDNNCEVVLNKELQDRIKALPPVTPTQSWILMKEYLKCSCCGGSTYDAEKEDCTEFLNYCPNCGAEMRGTEND